MAILREAGYTAAKGRQQGGNSALGGLRRLRDVALLGSRFPSAMDAGSSACSMR